MSNIYLTIVFSVGRDIVYRKHQYGSMLTSKGVKCILRKIIENQVCVSSWIYTHICTVAHSYSDLRTHWHLWVG